MKKQPAFVKTLPMLLSLSRIVLTPFIMGLLIMGESHLFVAILLFFLAIATDYFDGLVARRFSVVSKSGAFLDPLADKILVLSLFATLYVLRLMPLWALICIIVRDIVITFVRLLMQYQGVMLATSRLAKWKTASQFVFISGALFFLAGDARLYHLGDFAFYQLYKNTFFTVGIYSVVILSLVSGIHYIVKNRGMFVSLWLGERI